MKTFLSTSTTPSYSKPMIASATAPSLTYFNNTDGLIYVVDSLDRESISKAKEKFQTIIKDPFMINSIILVFANKQDMVCLKTIFSNLSLPHQSSEGPHMF